MSSGKRILRQISFSPDHPSLAGHFPGNPVLPGVVILDYVRQCIEEWRRLTVDASCLKSVKFLSPVLMSDTCVQIMDITLVDKSTDILQTIKIEFTCLQNDNLIAQGLWVFQADRSQ